MSSPRAATSVATSRSALPARNSFITRSRCSCVHAAVQRLARDSRGAFSVSVSSSTSMRVRQKTIADVGLSMSSTRPSAAGLCARGDDVGDLAHARHLAGRRLLARDRDARPGSSRCRCGDRRRCAAASSPRRAPSGASAGVAARIASRSSAKPMSSISSASSRTSDAHARRAAASCGGCDRARGPAWRRRRRRRASSARSCVSIERAAVDRQRRGRRCSCRSGGSPRRPASRARASARARGRRRRAAWPASSAIALQHRQRERRRLAGAGRRLAEDVACPSSSGGIASRWIGVGSS